MFASVRIAVVGGLCAARTIAAGSSAKACGGAWRSLASAPALGAGSREFKSPRPDFSRRVRNERVKRQENQKGIGPVLVALRAPTCYFAFGRVTGRQGRQPNGAVAPGPKPARVAGWNGFREKISGVFGTEVGHSEARQDFMRTRPRTKLVKARKARRCNKCGAKLNSQRIRCKRCANTQAIPGK